MKDQETPANANGVGEATSEAPLPPVTGYASFEDVRLNDPYVNHIMRMGGNVEQCVVTLANQKNELLRRVIELEAIAPRKIQTADGKVMIWRCPDDLVPLMRHNDPSSASRRTGGVD